MTDLIPLSYIQFKTIRKGKEYIAACGIGDSYDEVKSINLDLDTKTVIINYLESFQDGTNEKCYNPSPLKTVLSCEQITRTDYASEAELEYYSKNKQEPL